MQESSFRTRVQQKDLRGKKKNFNGVAGNRTQDLFLKSLLQVLDELRRKRSSHFATTPAYMLE